jgi:hypothetical protein
VCLCVGAGSKRQRVLGEYVRLLVVRHPMTRVASAYRDKMGAHVRNMEYARIRDRVIREARRSEDKFNTTRLNNTAQPTTIAADSYEMPTFAEFIDHAVFSRDRKISWDKHWRPTHAICDPCHTHFHHIIKLETFSADVAPILAILAARNATMERRLRDMLTPKNKHSTAGDSTVSEIVPEMLELSVGRRKNLERLYARDMQLFGYGFDSDQAKLSFSPDTVSCHP